MPAGQQEAGGAARVSLCVENVSSITKRDANICLCSSLGLGPGLFVSCAQEIPGSN